MIHVTKRIGDYKLVVAYFRHVELYEWWIIRLSDKHIVECGTAQDYTEAFDAGGFWLRAWHAHGDELVPVS